MLPDYIAKTTPRPAAGRVPWYVSTAPSYAGTFLWVVFYMEIAQGTLDRMGVALSLAALAVAALVCYALFYRAPAMMGMQTGYPLYVVGSSTFGTKGGYLMPGLLMGLLQVGWYSVNVYVSTTFIMKGLKLEAGAGSWPFAVAAILWGYSAALVGVLGIRYVARVALYLNLIPLAMILIVFARTAPGVAEYSPPSYAPYIAFMLLIQMVVGFFSTAGAAGTDFGMNNRDERDVRLGGLVGVSLASFVAGGLPLVSVAGAHVVYGIQGYTYDAAIAGAGGILATAMFLLFAVASIPPACFCSFIAGNSFETMLPKIPRMASTMTGITVALVLAITGVAANLVGLFTIVGASFGPICGAMTADYLRAGRRWAGPREGISIPGYLAWALGFVVGILPFLPIPAEWKPYTQPAVVYSYLTAFVVYWLAAKAGLEPKTVALPTAASR
ncbi:MAG: cytosine permease [Bryobacteraceae bacterium]|nr:cytosine permease [Bryobacteraceae bacterium]